MHAQALGECPRSLLGSVFPSRDLDRLRGDDDRLMEPERLLLLREDLNGLGVLMVGDDDLERLLPGECFGYLGKGKRINAIKDNENK